jgi:hypothetical protein
MPKPLGAAAAGKGHIIKKFNQLPAPIQVASA